MNLEQEQIDNVLLHYDISDCTEVMSVSTGYANFNYKLTTGQGEYLYRIFKEKKETEIDQEISLMEALRKKKFPTAYPIPRKDERYITINGSRTVVIYEFIRGTQPEINASSVSSVARLVAQLSTVEVEPVFERPNGININSCSSMLDEMDKIKVDFPDLLKVFAETNDRLAPFLSHNLPSGLIHGDLFPDNTVLREDGVLMAIDFEDYSIDHLLFDVGMTINGFCFYENELDFNLLGQFLREYELIRPLEDIERKLLPYYIQWTAHGTLAWHLSHFDKTNEKQLSRVYELIDRLEILKQNESLHFLEWSKRIP